MSDLPTEQQIARLNRVYVIEGKKVKPTLRQFEFVKCLILNGRNGTQAAIEAKYSEKTAKEIASQNLTKPIIIKMLEELELIMIQRYIMSFDKKRGMLGKIAETTSQIIEIEMEEVGSDGKKTKMKAVQDAKSAIMAIGEDNKMAGHHKEKETVMPIINLHFNKVDMDL